MHKAIQLKVLLWIEGESEPAADFAAITEDTLRDIIQRGAAAHPELSVRVDSISEYSLDDEEQS